MKNSILHCIIGLLIFFGSAFGSDPEPVDSRITAVSLFADSAQVTREVNVSVVTGENRYIISGLPASLRRGALQVERVSGVRVVLRDARVRLEEEKKSERTISLREQIEEKEKSIRALNEEGELAQKERQFAENLAKSFTDHYGDKEEGGGGTLDQAEQTWDYVQRTLQAIQKTFVELDERRSDLREERNELKKDWVKAQAEDMALRASVNILVEAEEPGEAVLAIRYLVPGSGWTPRYEVRADIADGQINLRYLAEVYQTSLEPWDNVALTLHTNQASNVVRALELHALFLEPGYRERPQSYMKSADRISALREEEMAMPAVKRGFSSFQVELPGPVSLPGDGERARLPIQEKSFFAKFQTEVVPALRAEGYLMADTKNAFDLPILPGEALIFVDGKLTVRTNLKQVLPEEEITLFLGVDENLRVKRREGKQVELQTGLIDKTTTLRRQYYTDMTSFHATAHVVKMLDRFPLSRHDKIEVRQMSPTDKQAKIDEDTGKFEWLVTLKPREPQTLETRFDVIHPREWVLPPF